MHWVYILKCHDGCYYVGETKRLYRRFWEHIEGRGGLNTSVHIPENIVAIYKVPVLWKFFEYNHRVVNRICNIYFNRNKELLEDFNGQDSEEEYDHLIIENNITELLMYNRGNWRKVRGGKYTRFDIDYPLPKDECILKSIPLCDCGLPCDVKKNEEHNYLFFRCAKKNMWNDMREEFNIHDDPCKFFMKYTKDIDYNLYYEKKRKEIGRLVNKSYWLQNLIGEQHEYCIGNCGKKYDGENTVRYSRKAINLCFDCFVNKYEELSKKYTTFLIDDY